MLKKITKTLAIAVVAVALVATVAIGSATAGDDAICNSKMICKIVCTELQFKAEEQGKSFDFKECINECRAHKEEVRQSCRDFFSAQQQVEEEVE